MVQMKFRRTVILRSLVHTKFHRTVILTQTVNPFKKSIEINLVDGDLAELALALALGSLAFCAFTTCVAEVLDTFATTVIRNFRSQKNQQQGNELRLTTARTKKMDMWVCYVT